MVVLNHTVGVLPKTARHKNPGGQGSAGGGLSKMPRVLF